MNFPTGCAPRMMITFLAEPTDRRTHIGVRLVVLVVPHQETGDANFVRLASGRSKTIVGQAEECRQLLNSNAAAIKQSVRPRCDFTNDRGRIADLGRMIR